MDNRKNKWLIIFPDSWISYSPSCLNFLKMIKEQDDEYSIVYLNDGEIDNSKLNISNKYEIEFKTNIFIKIIQKFRLFKFYKLIKFIYRIKKDKLDKNIDYVVGFDDIGYLIAKFFNNESIYYSLEISKSILNKFIFKYLYVHLLIIQSEERKLFLTSNKFQRVSYIQNSNFYKVKYKKEKIFSKKLIYIGNVIPNHGIEESINVLYDLKDYTLTIKGIAKYKDNYLKYIYDKYKYLIDTKRLIFDFNYIEQEALIDYISQFDIGLCFYSQDFKINNDFNYLSSPSGKMFNYFSSAIPIVGVNCVGLFPIQKYNAGILIDFMDSKTIIDAIIKIKSNYKEMKNNSECAAINYDFRKMFLENKQLIYTNVCKS